MKILITGGSGFIGSSLARQLTDNNIVEIWDTKKCIDISTKNITARNVNLVNDDLSGIKETDFDYIIHLAAILGVQNVIENPYDTLDSNIKMLTTVIPFAKRQKFLKKILFASTSEVYAGSHQSGELSFPTKETSKLVLPDLSINRNSYMLSKIYGEALIHASGLPYTIIRPHNIYGPNMGMKHVIPQLIHRVQNADDSSTIFIKSLNHTRTFCYIDDAIYQIKNLLFSDSAVNETYNVGSTDEEISIKKLSMLICKLLKKDLVIEELDQKEGSPSRRQPDMQKTLEIVGMQIFTKINDGLVRCINSSTDAAA